MEKVFLVSSGCYSDYGIRAVFSTRKKAQRFIDDVNTERAKDRDGDSYMPYWTDHLDIEEWDLDKMLKAKMHKVWTASVWLDTGEVNNNDHFYEDYSVPISGSSLRENVPAYGGRGMADGFSHKSQAHALKMAIEARQAWLRKKTEIGVTG